MSKGVQEMREFTRWPARGRMFQAVGTASAKVLGWDQCLLLEEHHRDSLTWWEWDRERGEVSGGR